MTTSEQRRFDEPGPTLEEAGESRLLGLLRAIAESHEEGSAVRASSGDDGAVWRPPAGRDLVVSQDCLVEGVDFRREWIRPHQLGRRALMVALSDLAGMGARPAYCLATLCAPGSTRLDDVLAIQRGLCGAAREAGCAPLGGDVSDTTGPLVVDVSVAGTVAAGEFLRRGVGAPGDSLIVTGVLGRAAAGLRLLGCGGGSDARPQVPTPEGERWVRAQLEPVAAVAEGEALVRRGVRCGGDISDGLLADAIWTAAESSCAAELWLDALPVDASLREVFGGEWQALALGGGEDFELLAAAAPAVVEAVRRGWDDTLRPLTVVGRLVEGSGVRLLDGEGGAELALPPVVARHYG